MRLRINVVEVIDMVGDIYEGLRVQVNPIGQPGTVFLRELRYAVVEVPGVRIVARTASETEPPLDE